MNPNSKIDFHEINKSQYDPEKLQIGNFCDNEHIKEIDPMTISKMEKQAQSVACMIYFQNPEELESENFRLCNTVTLAKKIETKIKNQLEQGFEVIGAKESNMGSSKKEILFGENEAFRDELAPGYGTAFFIGKRFVLTAAHCICLLNSDCLDTNRIQKTKLVFNFKKIEKNKPIFSFFTKENTEVTFDESDVFGIKRVVCHKFCKKEKKMG